MKAIKLENETYFDSSSIVHNREKLSELLQVGGKIIVDCTEIFKIKKKISNVTVNANEFKSIILGDIPSIEDYTYIGMFPNNNGYGDQWLISYSEYNGKICAMVHSKYGFSITNNLILNIVYIKNEYIDKVII